MKDLIPPDPARCQALKPTGQHPLKIGYEGRYRRCENTPTVIAGENKPGDDGRQGSMSLCDDCKAVLREQLGPDHCTFVPVEEYESAKARLAGSEEGQAYQILRRTT